ncbi:hypothetical protein MRX96_029830 [Rhipicephalus microplus]
MRALRVLDAPLRHYINQQHRCCLVAVPFGLKVFLGVLGKKHKMTMKITVTLLLLAVAVALATDDKTDKGLGENADAYGTVLGGKKEHGLKKDHSHGSYDNVCLECLHRYGLGGYNRDRPYGHPSYVPRHHGPYVRY